MIQLRVIPRPWSDEIDAELILLGTGSTMPSKFRNVSSSLLRFGVDSTPGGLGSIMLDAGEGTMEQLFTIFGPGELPGVLRSLGVIFISHLHADHHFGLADVVRKRQAAIVKWKAENGDTTPVEPVIITGPKVIGDWLDTHVEAHELAFIFVKNTAFDDTSTQRKAELNFAEKMKTDGTNVLSTSIWNRYEGKG